MSVTDTQFVIQQHTTESGVHWDFMLQQEDCLWTWRIPIPPEQMAEAPVILEMIADHPLRFLSYEGPVQNNTGSVQIADRGSVTILQQTDDEIILKAAGHFFSGQFQLLRQSGTHWKLARIG